MRFWDIKSGALKISKTDIKEINTNALRNMESYTTQDTSIFKDTIENNIKIAIAIVGIIIFLKSPSLTTK